MPNMSFMLTTEQVRRGDKTVTRRIGWPNLKPDTVVDACVKCQGLKKGERVEKIRPFRTLSTRWEPLRRMTDDPEYGKAECIKEGFPDLSPQQFVDMFCKNMRCTPETEVNRIEFEYIEE